MKKLLTILLLFPLLSKAQFFTTGFEGSVPFNGNYPATGFTGATGGTTYGSYAISTDYARKGTRSIKFQLLNGPSNALNDLKRELTYNYLPAGAYVNTTARDRNPIGMRWIRFSILIPPNNIDNTVCGIGINIKEVWDNYPTPCQMTYEDGVYYMTVTDFPTVLNKDSARQTKYSLGAFTKGIWDDFILERNYRGNSTGFVRVYRRTAATGDYVQVLSTTGANWIPHEYNPPSNTASPHHSKEAYLNFGIYKWAYQSSWFETSVEDTAVAYFDEFAVYDSTFTLNEVKLDGDVSPNQSPTVSIPAPSPTMNSSISLTATASDPDGTIASYSWTQVSGPNTASLSGQTTNTLTASSLVNGTYIFQCTVTDNLGATASANVSVTKSNNTLPELSLNDDGFYINATSVIANIDATDAEDGTNLTYVWYESSELNATISDPNAKNPTFSNLKAGNYAFTVTVRDQNGGETTGTFTFKVRIRFSQVKFKKGKIKVS